MRLILIISFLAISLVSCSQSKDEEQIRSILATQTAAWNRGDIENFMKGYWDHDSLMFIGKSGVTYGYKNTLENYKKSYPDLAAMGKLTFTLIQVKKLSNEFYHVTGKWHLERTVGNLSGHYTLLFQKIKGQWVIISDHSS